MNSLIVINIQLAVNRALLPCQIKSPSQSLPLNSLSEFSADVHIDMWAWTRFGIQIDFCAHLLRALESNQYNHITATYFLLAERMLRERQEKEQHSQTRSPSPSKAQFRYPHAHTFYTNRLLSLQSCVLSISEKTFWQPMGRGTFFSRMKDRLRKEETLQISIIF